MQSMPPPLCTYYNGLFRTLYKSYYFGRPGAQYSCYWLWPHIFNQNKVAKAAISHWTIISTSKGEVQAMHNEYMES